MDYEKLGAFYFGKQFDMDAGEVTDDLVLYEAKDLCTHGICVGMTGSGKTGLCVGLIEEAAIDGIPVIAIDPKGDLSNLMLTFPDLKAGDFEPWVDPAEATRKGESVQEYAKSTAAMWKKGLAEWDQKPDRIQRLKDAADVVVYTPASNAGIPVTVLRSFNAPPEAVRSDSEALRERIMSAVSGLLALMSVEADPLSSREHILLSTILNHAWKDGKDVDMAGMIRAIQAPEFDKVGFMDLETFYPSKERFKLAMQLNNLLASPGFQAWMEGEPLDIQRMLYTPEGKPKISIVSIAHLSDSERMFFVTILLNEVLTWVRAQPGTSSLRAMLYMDEVFGYFPPTANPPSKQPMLTLLKQARAFGLGVMLATQNPVDLDYKGLSNCGTWFIGRLQTERDKMRVMEGLEGASAQAGSNFDKQKMEATLAGLGSRVFLMNNVHDDEPIVFHTRWALSYLRGPMTRNQIETLMDSRRAEFTSAAAPSQREELKEAKAEPKRERPVLPPGIEEAFMPLARDADDGERLIYRPALFGSAKLHYSKSTSKVDMFREVHALQDCSKRVDDDMWEEARLLDMDDPEFDKKPEKDAEFADIDAELTQKKNYTSWKTDLKNHLYRNQPLTLWKCKKPKAVSEPEESEGDFRVRLSQMAREDRDIAVEKLRKKYAPKLASAQERIRKAEQRVDREIEQQKNQKMSAMISMGTGLLGALFGRKLGSSTNVTRAGTAMRSVTRASKEKQDVNQARDTVEAYQMKFEDLETEFADEINELSEKYDPDNIELDEDVIRPKKTELAVTPIKLLWIPWIIDTDGIAEPAWE